MSMFVLLGLLAAAFGQQTPSMMELDEILQQLFSPVTNVSNPVDEGNTLLLPVTESPQNRVNQASTLVPSLVTDSGGVSCLTESGKEGKCVQYFLCNKDGDIIKDGTGILNIRQDKGPCPSYLDSCCLLPDILPADKGIKPPITAKKGCGWRNPQGVAFRIEGDVNNEAKFGEFPWMVATMKTDESESTKQGVSVTQYLGGGSLIHPSVVLTAAHIVAGVDVKRLRARAGEWDTNTQKEPYPYQETEVKEVALHEEFNKNNLFNDVGLLFLSTPMDFLSSPHIGVVCLPPAGERAVSGAICQASGWGKDKFGKTGKFKNILKRVEVPVVDRDSCQAKLRTRRVGPYFELHTTFMCAGGKLGVDTCQGDGGSPLVCPIQKEKDRYVQNGIVAWGLGCGEDGTPGVYVDIANLRNWIDNKVISHGYDTKTYTP